MTYNPDVHHRRSIRLREYDYSSAGAYFVTLCVQGRECLFGGIVQDDMVLNEAGRKVEGVWRSLPDRFPNVTLDEFVVMPNHLHGVIVVADNGLTDAVGAIHELPDTCCNDRAIHELPLHKKRRTMLIPKVIGFFKMNTAKQINLMPNTPGIPLWQRNYHERVIRGEREMTAIREYIRQNPLKWEYDQENPETTTR
ncbi:transposase [Geobacter sp.]|uniref:transposase n=1 Tax=Geobacter sp. TaxID=46610 RepID=UPI0027B912E8|nr:transposase [Geobacter sp.]